MTTQIVHYRADSFNVSTAGPGEWLTSEGDCYCSEMVTFLDPRAEPGALVEPYELQIDAELTPITIGLVANGFPDSEEFLDQVEKAFAIAVPTASFRRWNKHDASATISDEMLEEVVADCQAVVAAYGH